MCNRRCEFLVLGCVGEFAFKKNLWKLLAPPVPSCPKHAHEGEYMRAGQAIITLSRAGSERPSVLRALFCNCPGRDGMLSTQDYRSDYGTAVSGNAHYQQAKGTGSYTPQNIFHYSPAAVPTLNSADCDGSLRYPREVEGGPIVAGPSQSPRFDPTWFRPNSLYSDRFSAIYRVGPCLL